MTVSKQVMLTLLSQGLLSATNFAVGLLLINSITKENYGNYVIAATAILWITGYQNALVTTQMTVLAPHKSPDDRRLFCHGLAIGQWMIFVPIALLALLYAAYSFLAPDADAQVSVLILAFGVALLPVLRKEFLRSYLFLNFRADLVFRLDIVFIGAYITAVSLLYFLASAYLASGAIMGVGLASLVVALIGHALIDRPPTTARNTVLPALGEAIQHGKWAAGGVTLTNLQSHSHVYMLGLFATAAAIAEVSAAYLLVVPVMLLSTSLTKVLLPRWATSAKAEGIDATARAANRTLAAVVAVAMGYVAVVYLVIDPVAGLLFPDDYTNVANLFVLWGGVALVQLVRSNRSMQLQSMHKFYLLFKANIFSALTVVIVSYILIKEFGPEGAVGALLIGELLLALMLEVTVRSLRKYSDS